MQPRTRAKRWRALRAPCVRIMKAWILNESDRYRCHYTFAYAAADNLIGKTDYQNQTTDFQCDPARTPGVHLRRRG